jgi:hypothetical protein
VHWEKGKRHFAKILTRMKGTDDLARQEILDRALVTEGHQDSFAWVGRADRKIEE